MNRQEKEWRKKNPVQAKARDEINVTIGKICKMYREGRSVREITQALSLTDASVESVIFGLNLRQRYFPKKRYNHGARQGIIRKICAECWNLWFTAL